MVAAHAQALQVVEEQIHENVVQTIVGAMLRLEAARRLHGSNSERGAMELDAVAELLAEGVERARQILNSLPPPLSIPSV